MNEAKKLTTVVDTPLLSMDATKTPIALFWLIGVLPFLF